MGHNLNSRSLKGIISGLLRGILGVSTIAHMVSRFGSSLGADLFMSLSFKLLKPLCFLQESSSRPTSQRVQVPNSWVLGFWVIVIVV